MPVYNAAPFVGQALQSIIDQTYQNIELIVVNDNSKDESLKIIASFKRKYPKKITVINLKSNLNVGGDAATNVAIQKTKGDYIAKMDADDIADPKRIKKQVEYLQTHSDIYLVGTNAYVINKEGQIVGEKSEPTSSREIFNEFIYFHPLIHPSVMFRRPENIKNFYKIKYPTANDYYTFFSLLCEGRHFANLPEKLLYYRIYGGNASLKNIKKGLKANMRIKMEMITKQHYPVDSLAIAKNVLFFVAGMILPQKLSYYAYLFSKHIITKKDIFAKMRTTFSTFQSSIFHFNTKTYYKAS